MATKFRLQCSEKTAEFSTIPDSKWPQGPVLPPFFGSIVGSVWSRGVVRGKPEIDNFEILCGHPCSRAAQCLPPFFGSIFGSKCLVLGSPLGQFSKQQKYRFRIVAGFPSPSSDSFRGHFLGHWRFCGLWPAASTAKRVATAAPVLQARRDCCNVRTKLQLYFGRSPLLMHPYSGM